MPDGLYEQDFLVWSEHQAALLRRMANGERVNEAVDWPNLIEEVEDLGLSQLRACETLLRQAMLHIMKLNAGDERPRSHWRGEVAGFLADAQARFTPSMRQRLDLQSIYVKARKQFMAGDPELGQDLPAECPFTLDDLLDEELGVISLEDKLVAGP